MDWKMRVLHGTEAKKEQSPDGLSSEIEGFGFNESHPGGSTNS